MNSETIKEIKECLEVLNEYGETYITKDQTQRKFVHYADILTYINELESENKDLQDLCNKTYDDLTKEIDRLENEIKGNVFYAKGYAQGIKNTYEVVMPNKLKQFAERLKEKMSEGEYLGHKYKLAVFRDIDIDETLNEFLKGENNE